MNFLPAPALRGTYTPLVTPFRNGRIDYGAYAALVDWQIKRGANGLVVAGTTGEPMALSLSERKDLLRVAVDTARQRVPVIAATGAASFYDTLALTEHADMAGAAGSLVLTPIYAKPTQRGLVEYFCAVASVTSRPVLIYQIPSRTNVTATLDTCAAIVAHAPNVVGMKLSVDDRPFVAAALDAIGPDFRIFMGLSEVAWDMIAQGASGIIVAIANVLPAEIRELYEAAAAGCDEDARRLHDGIAALNKLAFAAPNPVAVKYMLWRMGIIPTLEYRLPLVPPEEDLVPRIDAALAAVGLI